MIAHTTNSIVDAALLNGEDTSSSSDSIESNVLALFDRSAPQLLRYVGSFGLPAAEAEDVVQDTFLALFRHLYLRRDQTNLTGWLFQVAHNLALKRREQRRKHPPSTASQVAATRRCIDPALDPEERLMHEERGQRLRAVFDALPERDRRCLFLRAEGLTYRAIAHALNVSLGSVSKAVSRALTRFTNVDGG